MSTQRIVALIDEEIERLQEARAILADMVRPTRRRPQLRQKTTERMAEVVQVTVVAARVPRQPTIRSKQRPVPLPTALSSAAPTGAFAVSALEAARNKARAIPADTRAPRWQSGRPVERLTIDDLFNDAVRTGEPTSAAE